MKIAQEFKRWSADNYIDFYNLGAIYAAVGEKDEAFKFLERAYEQRSTNMSVLAVDPSYDAIRNDPRFANLLQRLGLRH